MPDYITTEEAAEILGYHLVHIRKMVREGKLRADKKAGIWWVHRDGVEKYRKSIEGKAKNDPTRGA